jgi:hypothetical protein
MDERVMSRRKFLVGAGAVVAAGAGISGLIAVEKPSTAKAAGTALPWPYPTTNQPDPETLGRRAYEVYFSSGCAEATWWPIIEALAAADPASPWATLPKNMFKFGGGGVDGYGTICGCLNGSCAVTAMVVPQVAGDSTKPGPGPFEDALMEYYANTPLPTNGIDRAYAAGAGWTPAAPAVAPRPNVPTSIAHSQLCHSSLSQWAMTAGNAGQDTTINAIGKPGQKDRCAKLCYDLTFRTVTLLNAYFAGTAVPTTSLDPSVAACKTCHSPNVQGKMACDPCHDETTAHSLQ